MGRKLVSQGYTSKRLVPPSARAVTKPHGWPSRTARFQVYNSAALPPIEVAAHTRHREKGRISSAEGLGDDGRGAGTYLPRTTYQGGSEVMSVICQEAEI